MRHRKLAISVAMVGSFGIALAPALAEAASQTSTSHSTAISTAKNAASAFVKAVQQHKTTFTKTKALSRHGATTGTTPNPTLDIGVAAMDTSAYGVELDLLPSGLVSGSATITISWGDSSADSVQTVNSSTTSVSVAHEFADAGIYNASVTIDDGSGDSVTSTGQLITAGSDYTAYGPVRILDTRKAIGTPAAAAIGAGGTLKLKVAGAGAPGSTIPQGITAVVLNVTAVSPTANGFLTVYGDQDMYGDPETLPATSNVNFRTGQNIPNLVVVPVGANGTVDFHNGSKGSTQVLADVAGYFTTSAANRYVGITPARILDTRKGIGTGGTVAKIPAGGDVTLTVAGSDGGTIPATGVNAVSMNLTVVGGTKNGVITAYPYGQNLPTVSNLNYSAGQTVANMSIVPVGTDGKVVLHNDSTGPVDLIADANGYYSATTKVATASSYVPFDAPDRFLDTRTTDGSSYLEGAVPTGKPIGVPYAWDSVITGAVFNATVVQSTGNGYLSLYPYDPTNPGAVPASSNLNYQTGQTVPNLAIAELGTKPDSHNEGAYDFGLYLGGSGKAQVILDEFGLFADQ